jgi:hypothetical protein
MSCYGCAWVGMGWHISCCGWAWVGIGHCWWVWSGYGYKFEGKCWALVSKVLLRGDKTKHVIFDLSIIFHSPIIIHVGTYT